MPLRFLTLLCFCCVNHLFAQTFSAVPGPLLSKELQFEQANECYIYFDNPSGNSLQLHWRLLESDLPEEWDADLCDYGLCYIGIPSNGLMSPVYDTIQPYLKLIVQPGTAPGATWIWFRVYEEGHEDNFVDVFYSLYTPGTLAASAPTSSNVLAYPNPAQSVLILENNLPTSSIASIRNLAGQSVWQGKLAAQSQQTISLDHWPNGLYLLQNGQQTQKILIQK